MPRFEPFAGLRYATGTANAPGDGGAVDALIAPPYDVVSDAERAALASRDPHNSIRLELPEPEAGLDRYRSAARLLDEWRAGGVVVEDPEPSFYVYRMDYTAGTRRQTTGVIGALELMPPGAGDVLPHEQTTPKAKSDRLDLLRATAANLSPVWGLSLASGLSDLCALDRPADLHGRDDEGVEHRLWRLTDPAALAAITGAVASAPVVIADGHHRYEVALAYQAERRAGGAATGTAADAIMALVVELSDDQLFVQAIHRLLSGLAPGLRIPDAFEPWFEVTETAPADASMATRMEDAGALGLITPAGAWLLRPRPSTVAAADHDLDSARLDVALAGLAEAGTPVGEVTFQHGIDLVAGAVASGRAEAAVLLRPATVKVIAETAHRRLLMPPKTTFFAPKPRTGLVFRSVA